jgi:hypothetical protein
VSDTPAPSKAIVELAVQSRDTTNAAFDALLPEVAKVASTMSNPQAAMGVVQALLRIAASLAYATIGTQLDVRIRTPEDAASLAAAHWKSACHLNSLVMHELMRQGLKVPPEMVRANNAAPPVGTVEAAVDASSAPNPQALAEQVAAEIKGEADAPAQPAGEQQSSFITDAMRINSRGGSS